MGFGWQPWVRVGSGFEALPWLLERAPDPKTFGARFLVDGSAALIPTPTLTIIGPDLIEGVEPGLHWFGSWTSKRVVLRTQDEGKRTWVFDSPSS